MLHVYPKALSSQAHTFCRDLPARTFDGSQNPQTEPLQLCKAPTEPENSPACRKAIHKAGLASESPSKGRYLQKEKAKGVTRINISSCIPPHSTQSPADSSGPQIRNNEFRWETILPGCWLDFFACLLISILFLKWGRRGGNERSICKS